MRCDASGTPGGWRSAARSPASRSPRAGASAPRRASTRAPRARATGARRRSSAEGEDDLAELAAGGEALIGVVDAVERERLCDRHGERAALEEGQDLALHGPGGQRLLL